MEILNDENVYEKFDENPLDVCEDNLVALLSDQVNSKNISQKLHRSLFSPIINKSCKFGSFRALPKLHKT